MMSRVRKQHTHFQFSFRNIFSVLFLILFVVALYSIFIYFTNADHFPIKQVKVYGIHQSNPEDIQKRLLPLVSKGFFAVNVEETKERLLQLPWVASVTVQRKWPDQMVVLITEKKPLARWNANNILSTTGEIFTPEKILSVNLPQFIGPEGMQINMLNHYKRFNEIFSSLHLKITSLELTPSLSWIIAFDNGIKVNAGHQDVLTRINHFVKVYPKIIGTRAGDVEYIDLRYSNGLAVRWKSVS